MQETLWEKFQQLSFTAAMNQRYYQVELQASIDNDAWWRSFIGILAIIALVLACIRYKVEKLTGESIWYRLLRLATYDRVSIFFAIVSIFVAWMLNASPLESDVVYNSDLHRRWSDLRRDADAMMVLVEHAGSDEELPPGAETRLVELTNRKNENNAEERKRDAALLERCHIEEETARGAKTASGPATGLNPHVQNVSLKLR